jgi:serine-type D-Ala-D-Ala carboxypeptidase (penicillin-binding protein 5/6)
MLRRLASAALLVGLLLSGVAPAAAGDDARPTADPGAPTPSAPYAGLPPQGHAPDGRTVGGEELDTRGIVVGEDAPPLPDGLAATGWLVADAGTGEVLAARDPHGRYYPASTLKTLTLLTLQPLLDPAQVVIGTKEDENVEGSRVGLLEGGSYPVSLLFQALILQSGNDAANALARAAGGVDVTVAAMNETAEAIGAYDTVAGTPSGLDVAGQSSSPYDLALIFRRLVADPRTEAVLLTPSAQIPGVPGRSTGYQIQNQDELAGYPGTLGGKSGFTDAARHTFVTAAERNGRRLVVSIMNTESKPLRAAGQAALLLDWGFALPPGTESVGTLVEPGQVDAAPTPVELSPLNVSVAPDRNEAIPVEESSSPWVPTALAACAVLAVAATLVGRRRAVRRAPGRSGTPPPPTGGSPSTPP